MVTMVNSINYSYHGNHYTSSGVLKPTGSPIREGDGFGELGIVNARPRLASVILTEHSELFTLEKEDFKNLLLGMTFNSEQFDVITFRAHHADRPISTSNHVLSKNLLKMRRSDRLCCYPS